MAQQTSGSRTRCTGWAGGSMPAVLMYHSVTPCHEDPYLVTVSPERFGQQMRWLRRRGLRGVSVAELLAARDSGAGDDLVGLTFDDGYADFAQHALPVLARHGFSATLFVIAGRLGGDNAWDAAGPRKPLLTARQVRQVAEAVIEIGSHGLRHVRLPSAAGPALTAETENSRVVLQGISGQPVAGFCYPYGDVDGRVVAGVREAGYEYGCAIWRSDHTGRHALPGPTSATRTHPAAVGEGGPPSAHLGFPPRGPAGSLTQRRFPTSIGVLPGGTPLATSGLRHPERGRRTAAVLGPRGSYTVAEHRLSLAVNGRERAVPPQARRLPVARQRTARHRGARYRAWRWDRQRA
jgi:peptidoglycan/xylan/chitin deacetylase (PgdA/CDA1 family)